MKQRATIVREVTMIYGEVQQIAEAPNNVPIMQLEDGRNTIAYECDRFIPEGTEGWAELDKGRGIWTFTPDPEPDHDFELKPGDLI